MIGSVSSFYTNFHCLWGIQIAVVERLLEHSIGHAERDSLLFLVESLPRELHSLACHSCLPQLRRQRAFERVCPALGPE